MIKNEETRYAKPTRLADESEDRPLTPLVPEFDYDLEAFWGFRVRMMKEYGK